LLALLASTSVCLGATYQLTPEAKKDLELQPGVVKIEVSFQSVWQTSIGNLPCKMRFSGTGFLYRPDGYLITNGHVVQVAHANDQSAEAARAEEAMECAKEAVQELPSKLGRPLNRAEIERIRAGRLRLGTPTLQVRLNNGKIYQGEIKAYSDPTPYGKDVAIVKIDGKNLPTVELGNSDGVNVGDQITVIGYPGKADISEPSTLVPTVTNGRISAINKLDNKGTPVLQSEATIDHGNSGGPAFDAAGRVIGIATYKASDSPGINFFVPIDTALEFVRQAGAQPERGSFDQKWHDALEAYAGQHWSKAHDLMGSVLEMMPDQPDAKRLQVQAGQNIPTNPVMRLTDMFGLPVVLGSAAVVLAIVIGIGGILVLKRGGKSTRTQPTTVTIEPTPAVLPSPQPVKPIPSARESFGSLQISNGPLAGNRFVIPKSGLMIGRDPSSCAVVLPSDAVSKQHVWVVPLDNGVAVIDRDSVNGTYVNSTDSPRINKVVLKDGDRIFLGRKSPTEIMYFSS
jgi:S1-C subfamily serine protease